jgi:hypothetical protein
VVRSRWSVESNVRVGWRKRNLFQDLAAGEVSPALLRWVQVIRFSRIIGLKLVRAPAEVQSGERL